MGKCACIRLVTLMAPLVISQQRSRTITGFRLTLYQSTEITIDVLMVLTSSPLVTYPTAKGQISYLAMKIFIQTEWSMCSLKAQYDERQMLTNPLPCMLK